MAMNVGKSLALAAAGGMVAGLWGCGDGKKPANPTNPTAEPAGTTDPGAGEKNCCKGKNECKEKGGCKTDANECAGKNECKEKGGCSKREC